MDPVRGPKPVFQTTRPIQRGRSGNPHARFHDDEDGLSHIIEFSLALIVILIILAGFFTAVESEFILHTPDDNKRQDECIRFCELLVGDTGSASLGGNVSTTDWEVLNATGLANGLVRPGFATSGEGYGKISHAKVIALRNLTYRSIRSTLSIRKYELNIEITEIDGSQIVTFGYSHESASKISETNRILVMTGDGNDRPVKFTFRLFEGIERRVLVEVNELMYHPEDGKNEWIELYNPTDEAVDLSSLALYFQLGQTYRDFLEGESLILPGRSYCLIVDDTGTADHYPVAPGTLIFMIKDGTIAKGGLPDDGIDFFFQGESFKGLDYTYTSEKGASGNGHSLEWSVSRLDWVESAAIGGTPGSTNSVS